MHRICKLLFRKLFLIIFTQSKYFNLARALKEFHPQLNNLHIMLIEIEPRSNITFGGNWPIWKGNKKGAALHYHNATGWRCVYGRYLDTSSPLVFALPANFGLLFNTCMSVRERTIAFPIIRKLEIPFVFIEMLKTEIRSEKYTLSSFWCIESYFVNSDTFLINLHIFF